MSELWVSADMLELTGVTYYYTRNYTIHLINHFMDYFNDYFNDYKDSFVFPGVSAQTSLSVLACKYSSNLGLNLSRVGWNY